MKKHVQSFIVNLGLLVWGLFAIYSGVLIQIKYHMGNRGHSGVNEYVFGVGYSGWNDIHKFSIVILSILAVYHVVLHWKWFKAVFSKKLFSKNLQVITFTLLFILAAVTGLIPWIIDLLGMSEFSRKVFIEIHDKIAIILSVYIIMHIVKRHKWFFNTLAKMANKRTA